MEKITYNPKSLLSHDQTEILKSQPLCQDGDGNNLLDFPKKTQLRPISEL